MRTLGKRRYFNALCRYSAGDIETNAWHNASNSDEHVA